MIEFASSISAYGQLGFIAGLSLHAIAIWLRAKYHSRVRFKEGALEIEAPTTDEVARLLVLVRPIRPETASR